MTVRRTGLSTERQDLGPVRLYREDLRAIAAAVREVGDLKITCDDEYEASEPSDFDHLPERLVNVEISGENTDAKRSITVEFTQNTAYINLVEPDTHAFGVVVRIKNICDQKRRFSRILYRDEGRILFLAESSRYLYIPRFTLALTAAQSRLNRHGPVSGLMILFHSCCYHRFQ